MKGKLVILIAKAVWLPVALELILQKEGKLVWWLNDPKKKGTSRTL